MKVTFKNFLHTIKRFKTATLLNVIGLTAALIVFIICAMQIQYDLTFNHSFKDYDKIHRIVGFQNTEYGDFYADELMPDRHEDVMRTIPELDENDVRLVSDEYRIGFEGDSEFERNKESFLLVDPQFIDFFGIHILAGSAEDALKIPNNLIISENTAKRLFGDKNPVDRYLNVEKVYTGLYDDGVMGIKEDTLQMKIAAVYKDFPNNSSFNNGFITLLNADDHFYRAGGGTSYRTVGDWMFYVKVDNKDKKSVLSKLQSDYVIETYELWEPTLNIFLEMDYNSDYDEDEDEDVVVQNAEVRLIPISNIHINYPKTLSPDKSRNKGSIIALISIAALILAIAYINYINFIIAAAPARIKSINIQRILGLKKGSVILSITLEVAIFTCIAYLIAILAVYRISSTTLSQFFTASISPSSNVSLLVGLGIVLAVISLIIGLYPAFFLGKHRTSAKYNAANSVNNKRLKTRLTIVQYIVTIVIALIAIFIKLQHSYMTHYALGFDKECVVHVSTKDASISNDRKQAFINEVIKSPLIVNYTSSSFKMGLGGVGKNGIYTGKKSSFYGLAYIDNRFFDFFNIRILEGRDKIEQSSTRAIVLNRLMYDEVPTEYLPDYLSDRDIVVVDNFHFQDIKVPLSYLIMEIYPNIIPLYSEFYFRTAAGKTQESIEWIEKCWKTFSKSDLNYSFLDEELTRSYKEERNLSLLLSGVAIMAILISLMGVYGFITFNTEYRAKEIAIRKVHGASIRDVIWMLNRRLVIQFIISFIIAVPISYYLIQKWLDAFTYRINIYWWIFILVGLFVLLMTIITVSIQSYKASTVNPISSLNNE